MKILKNQNTSEIFPGKYIFRDVIESHESGFKEEKDLMKREVLGKLNNLKDEINLSKVAEDFEVEGKKEKIVKRSGEKTKILRRDGGDVVKMKRNKIKIKKSWLKNPALKIKDINKNGEFDSEDLILMDKRYKVETKKNDLVPVDNTKEEISVVSTTAQNVVPQNESPISSNISQGTETKIQNQNLQEQKPEIQEVVQEKVEDYSELKEFKESINGLKGEYEQSGKNDPQSYLSKVSTYRRELLSVKGTKEAKNELFKKLDELEQYFEAEKQVVEEQKQKEVGKKVEKIIKDKSAEIKKEQEAEVSKFELEFKARTKEIETKQKELERQSANQVEAFKQIEAGTFQIEKETGFNAENLKTVAGARFELQKHFQAAETFGLEAEVLSASADEMGNIYQEFQKNKDSLKNTALGVVALVAAPFEGGRNMVIAGCKRLGGWLGWGRLKKWADRAEHTSVLGVLTGENKEAKKLTAQKEKFEQKYKEQSRNLGAKADLIAREGKQIKDAIVTNLPASQEIEKKDALDELEQSIAKEEKFIGVKMPKEKKQGYLDSFSAEYGKNELAELETLKPTMGELDSLHQNLKANHAFIEERRASIGQMEFKAADVWDATLGTLGRTLQKVNVPIIGGICKSIGKLTEGIGSIVSRPDRFVNALTGSIGFDFSQDRKSKYVWGGGNLRRFWWDGIVKGIAATESWKAAGEEKGLWNSIKAYSNAVTESATNVLTIYFTAGQGAVAGSARVGGVIGKASAKTTVQMAARTGAKTGMKANMARTGIFAKEFAKNLVRPKAWKGSAKIANQGWRNIGRGLKKRFAGKPKKINTGKGSPKVHDRINIREKRAGAQKEMGIRSKRNTYIEKKMGELNKQLKSKKLGMKDKTKLENFYKGLNQEHTRNTAVISRQSNMVKTFDLQLKELAKIKKPSVVKNVKGEGLFGKIRNLRNSKKLAKGKDVPKTWFGKTKGITKDGLGKVNTLGEKIAYGYGRVSATSGGKALGWVGRPLAKGAGRATGWTMDAIAWPFRKAVRNISRRSRTEFAATKTRTIMRPSQWLKKKTWGKVSTKVKGFTRRERWAHSRVSKVDNKIASIEAKKSAAMKLESTNANKGALKTIENQLTKANKKRTKLLKNPRREAAYNKINAAANNSEWTAMVDEVINSLNTAAKKTKLKPKDLKVEKFDVGLGVRLKTRASRAAKQSDKLAQDLSALKTAKGSVDDIAKLETRISFFDEKFLAFNELSRKVKGLSNWKKTAPVKKVAPKKATTPAVKTAPKTAPVKKGGVLEKTKETFVKENSIKNYSEANMIKQVNALDELLKTKTFDPSKIKLVEKSLVNNRPVYKMKIAGIDEPVLFYRSTGRGTPGLKKSGEWYVLPGFADVPYNGVINKNWFIKTDAIINLTKTGGNKFLGDMAQFFEKNYLPKNKAAFEKLIK